MFDFQKWENESEFVINLDHLPDIIANLNQEDSESQEPEPSREAVDFYLPDLLKNSMLSRFAQLQTETEEPVSQFADRLNEVSEQVLRPALKLSNILSAVVAEILQNHHIHSNYKVKISDG